MARAGAMILSLITFSILYAGPCQTQNANSRPNIESLIHMESEMIDFFNYALREEQRLHDGRDVHGFAKLYKFLGDVEPLNKAALDDVTKVSDDLLQILVLKRRLSHDWAPMLELIHKSEFVKRIPLTLGKIQSMQYVIESECDLRKSILEDILRIQHFYKASPRDLISPQDATNIESEDYARVMSAAKDISDYVTALEWTKFGHGMCNGSTDTAMKKYFLNLKAGIYIKMNKLVRAEKIYAYLAKSDPSSRSAASNLRFIQSKREQERHSPKQQPLQKNFTDDYVMQLCRGNAQPSKIEDRPLTCFIRTIKDLERPIFIEEVHSHPRIVILRNLFSSEELAYIKENVLPKMLQKLMLDEKYTVSSSKLREDSDTFYLQKFFSTIRNVTFQGSNVRRDDILSNVTVECEGPGGKDDIITHQPWYMKNLEMTLPIANFITFMNDVISGGGIAFPDLHLRVEPEKGSVLFWQFKTQRGPVHTHLRRYVNCPIAKGNQWVMRNTLEHRGLVRHIDL